MKRQIAYVSNDPVEAYKEGYAAGMEDARNAVASMNLPPNGPAAGLRAEALAAIDALTPTPQRQDRAWDTFPAQEGEQV